MLLITGDLVVRYRADLTYLIVITGYRAVCGEVQIITCASHLIVITVDQGVGCADNRVAAAGVKRVAAAANHVVVGAIDHLVGLNPATSVVVTIC